MLTLLSLDPPFACFYSHFCLFNCRLIHCLHVVALRRTLCSSKNMLILLVSLSLSLSCVSICLFLFVFMYMQLLSANLCKPSHAYKYKLRTIVRNYSAHSILKLSMLYFFFRNQNTHLGLVQKRREKGGKMVKCREILQTHF